MLYEDYHPSIGIENDTQQTERVRMGNVGYALMGIENDTRK